MPPKKISPPKGTAKKANPPKAASKKSIVKKSALKTIAAKNTISGIQEVLLKTLNTRLLPNPKPIRMTDLENRLIEFNVKSKVDIKKILTSVNKINPEGLVPVDKMPEDIKKSIQRSGR